MSADTSAGAGAVGVMGGAGRREGGVKIAVRGESVGGGEVVGVVVGGEGILEWRGWGLECRTEGVETDHVECCASRDDCFLIMNVLNALPWQTHGDSRIEAQRLFHESNNIRHIIALNASRPCVAIGVYFLDLVVGAILDLLAVRRGKVGHTHDDVARDVIEAGGHYAEAHRIEFRYEILLTWNVVFIERKRQTVVELRFWIFKDVACDARFVRSLGYVFF